jgi:Cdc6-like AAA superfamily ATPase
MDNFRKHCKRVEKEAGLAHMVESARNREVQRANRALQLRNDKLQRQHRLLTAIPSVDYWNKHSKLSSLRHPGTNIWIQKTSQYASWYTPTVSDCLCYLGIPGSGKSVLAASLVNDLSGASSHTGTIILYYYFDYAEVASLEPTHFVASLIKQCLEHMPLDQFSENFTSPYSDSMSAPTISICVNYLISVLHDFSKIYMVLDGLDQLTPSSQTMVLDLISNLLGDNSLVVKVLVTSRPEELFIKKTLQPYRTIQSAKDMVCGDIALFIEEEMIALMKQNPLLSNARLRREVVGALLSGADGM